MAIDSVPLTVVTDAKDVYDKGGSDTPSYGAQKSLAFTVAWIRSMLGRTGTDQMDEHREHVHRCRHQRYGLVTYPPHLGSVQVEREVLPLLCNDVWTSTDEHVHRCRHQRFGLVTYPPHLGSVQVKREVLPLLCETDRQENEACLGANRDGW